MTDIVAFLTARLDEDQAAAEGAQGEVWTKVGSGADIGPAVGRVLFHQRFVPGRVLVEVAVKRAIIARYEAASAAAAAETDTEAGWIADGLVDGLSLVLRQLAVVYIGHPDYFPAWRLDAED